MPAAAGGQHTIVGASELGEEDQADLAKVQEMLLTLRRKTVTFEILPSVSGASGPEYTRVQLEKFWEDSRLGYKFQRKKMIVARSFSRRSCSPQTWPSMGC